MADLNLQKYFNVTLAAALKNNASPASRSKTKYQLTIPGPSGGSWVVDTTLEEPTVTAGTADDAKVKMTVSEDDLKAVFSSPNIVASFCQAYFRGKVKAEGDQNKVLQFGLLFLLK
jgi:hypothetical protein